MSPSTAKKSYFKTTAISMTLYVAVIFAVAFYLKSAEVSATTKYILALLPTVFVWWYLWGAYRFYNDTDEYERSRIRTGVMFGVLFIMILTSGWGFMEMLADAPHLPVFYIFPIFCGAAGIGRYLTRSEGESC